MLKNVETKKGTHLNDFVKQYVNEILLGYKENKNIHKKFTLIGRFIFHRNPF